MDEIVEEKIIAEEDIVADQKHQLESSFKNEDSSSSLPQPNDVHLFVNYRLNKKSSYRNQKP